MIYKNQSDDDQIKELLFNESHQQMTQGIHAGDERLILSRGFFSPFYTNKRYQKIIQYSFQKNYPLVRLTE
ncbi:conserved domain protein [Streptococcus sp. oral taxon 056 str. F0418]|nr:conserved domain protein [Streptococcus sp. oral taxon 056 str. F0418]